MADLMSISLGKSRTELLSQPGPLNEAGRSKSHSSMESEQEHRSVSEDTHRGASAEEAEDSVKQINGENGEGKKRVAPLRLHEQAPNAKKQKLERSPELIRKQIEYYFSQNNLRRDRFFHSKISENAEGWLEMKYILSCKKIQAMEATESEIIAALEPSHLETKIDDNNVAWVRTPSPLPELELTEVSHGSKNNKNNQHNVANNRKPSRSDPKTAGDIHTYGCLLKVTEIPEEVSWVKLKEAMSRALQDRIGESLTGKDANRIRFVSPVTSVGEAFIYCRKFPGDLKLISTVTSLEVNGTSLTVSLVNDLSTAIQFFQTMIPQAIRKDREKEHMKRKADMMTRPLMIGGTKFESVEHLKRCYKELLDKAQVDVEIKPTAYKVIRALLNYHPNASVKAKDVVAIKVSHRKDLSEATKCFFLVRSDGTSEDFSALKCIDGLMRNPPFVEEDEQVSRDTGSKPIPHVDDLPEISRASSVTVE